MSRRIVIAVLALAACETTAGTGGGGAKVAESGTAKGSAAGFSAQMSAELAKAGIGEPSIPPVAAPSGTAGSFGAPAATAPGTTAPGTTAPATTSAGSGSIASAPGSGSAAAPATATPATGSATPATAVATPAAGSAASSGTPVTPASPGSAGKDTTATALGAVKAPANRAYAKPAAEIAAIKLELEPNWERDMGEAGTFSLVVKVPSTDDSRVFSVRYGYEDAAAPIDCDQYRKFLEDKGAMKVTVHRQRGAACYLEGTDKGGVIAYRFLLTYGGKRLMCHGSLYKDAASAALGDLRDKVLMQAKKICETLAL